MEYQIEIREIEPVRVAYIKYKGFAPEANKVFPNVFKSIRGQTNGATFFSYLSMNTETKIGDMELCVPTEATPAGNGIEVKELPRIKAVCVTHIGSYPDALRAGRYASCAGGRVHETPLAKQADPGHPKGQPMRKRRAQGQQAAASGAFS